MTGSPGRFIPTPISKAKTRSVLTAAFAALAVGFAAVAAVTSVAAATQSVSVDDNFYADATSSNSTTTISVGDTVQWTFVGANPHTVTSTSSESFDSGAPQTSGTFSHTFNTAGTFAYICGIHGTLMQGTVIVQAAATPTQTTAAPTNTPVPATNTPVPSTSVASATTAAGTPTQPASTSTAATPTVSSTTATPASAASPGAVLPPTGSGASRSGAPWAWLIAAALAATGSAVTALALRRR